MYIIENSEGKFKLFTNKKLAKLETDVVNYHLAKDQVASIK